MEIDQANKIIAEYMSDVCYVFLDNSGTYKIRHRYHDKYTLAYSESLDALIPVWEKTGLSLQMVFDYIPNSINRYSASLVRCADYASFHERGATLQQAACVATAKAIQDLNKGK